MDHEKRVRRGVNAAVLGCLLAAGPSCNKLKALTGSAAQAEEATPLANGPLVLEWSESYKLVVRGSKAEATFFLTRDADKPPLRIQASFSEFPKGTKLKIGDEQQTLGDSGYWSTLIDVKPAIVKQTLEDLKAPVELGQEVSIEAPGSPVATTKLPKQNVKDGLRAALAKARDGGMTFGASDVAAGKPRGVAVLSAYNDLDFIGVARTLEEVDWVAVAEDAKQPRGVKTCQFKQGPSQVKLVDANVLVVERRTGKKVTEKVLPASDECPMFAFVDKQDNTAKNTVGSTDVTAWVREELERAAK
jgi:hypothetical protein